MKKIIKKVKEEPITVEEVKATVIINKEIAKLSCSFPNEDMNKVVEKINEIIEKQNGN